jgi:GntR family transcriptional regulator
MDSAYTVYIDMHSGLIISQADPRPMYLQIKEQIRHRVAVGDWPPGHEIPSIRQLAIEIRVSVITVKRAYLELELEGVIVTHHGKGSFVADGVDIATSAQERELDEHLAAAVRIGRLLGLSDEALAARLRQIGRDKVKRKA